MTTRTLPPLTGTPLDYVPIDAPILKKRPVVFTAPTLRRAVKAAFVAALVVAFFVFPILGLTAIALGVMAASVWGGEKLADRLAGSTGMWPPNPHSWWPAVVAALAIAAIIHFS